MCAQLVDLSLERVDDERQRLRIYLLDTLLNDVVTVLIQHALQHVSLQLLHLQTFSV